MSAVTNTVITANWKELIITQSFSASVSFIASSTIVAFILIRKGSHPPSPTDEDNETPSDTERQRDTGNDTGRLSSPYRRLIFALSVSDIIQSWAILAGPWLPPSDSPTSHWALGNKITCQIDGLLFLIGTTAVPMYTLCLCVYYVQKLKHKMSDEAFLHKFEKKMHITIISLNLILYLTAVAMDTVHATPFGNICTAAAYPTGCRQSPDIFGECDPVRTSRSVFFLAFNSLINPVLCYIGIISCIVIIIKHAIFRERVFGSPAITTRSRSNSNSNEQHIPQPPHVSDNSGDQDVNIPTASMPVSQSDSSPLRLRDHEAISRLYKRELATQAFGYVGVFCLTALPFLTMSIVLLSGEGEVSIWLMRANVFLGPLGGLFNILVYTRPNVASLRRRHPECSRLWALCLVFRAGGEVPKEYPGPFCSMCPWADRAQSQEDIPQDMIFDSAILHYAPPTNASALIGAEPSQQDSMPDSMGVINGQSLSLDEKHIMYRLSKDWSYIKGEGSRVDEIQNVDTGSGSVDIQGISSRIDSGSSKGISYDNGRSTQESSNNAIDAPRRKGTLLVIRNSND